MTEGKSEVPKKEKAGIKKAGVKGTGVKKASKTSVQADAVWTRIEANEKARDEVKARLDADAANRDRVEREMRRNEAKNEVTDEATQKVRFGDEIKKWWWEKLARVRNNVRALDKKERIRIGGIGAGILVIGIVVGVVLGNVVPVEVEDYLADADGCAISGDSEKVVMSAEEIEDATVSIMDEVNDMSNEDAISYLNSKVEEYAGTSMEYEARSILIYQYIEDGEDEQALEELQKVDPDTLDLRQMMDYTNALAKVYRALGEYDLAKSYQVQYATLYNIGYAEVTGGSMASGVDDSGWNEDEIDWNYTASYADEGEDE